MVSWMWPCMILTQNGTLAAAIISNTSIHHMLAHLERLGLSRSETFKIKGYTFDAMAPFLL